MAKKIDQREEAAEALTFASIVTSIGAFVLHLIAKNDKKT